jgi:hypothetical protein
MPELEEAAVQAPETSDKATGEKTGRYFVRFTRAQRTMHAVLFTTFLGLAATGLPLRFSGSIWARRLASEVGDSVPFCSFTSSAQSFLPLPSCFT